MSLVKSLIYICLGWDLTCFSLQVNIPWAERIAIKAKGDQFSVNKAVECKVWKINPSFGWYKYFVAGGYFEFCEYGQSVGVVLPSPV